jgi:hypothetical protein
MMRSAGVAGGWRETRNGDETAAANRVRLTGTSSQKRCQRPSQEDLLFNTAMSPNEFPLILRRGLPRAGPLTRAYAGAPLRG